MEEHIRHIDDEKEPSLSISKPRDDSRRIRRHRNIERPASRRENLSRALEGDPKYFKFKDVPVVVMANFAIGAFCARALEGHYPPRAETAAFTGPILADEVSEVLVAKAAAMTEAISTLCCTTARRPESRRLPLSA
jgi:hypothetical protein